MKKNALIKKLVWVILEANERWACILFDISWHVQWMGIRMAESKNNYNEEIGFPHVDRYGKCVIHIDCRYKDSDAKKIQDIIDFISNKYL